MADLYAALPANVRLHIFNKQATDAWQNNIYRDKGELRPDAFQLAFEWGVRETFLAPNGKEKSVLHRPAWSLADLQQDIAKQTPELWQRDPFAHYDVKSPIFTLAEMKGYLASRAA